MEIDLVTKADLQAFRIELLNALEQILSTKGNEPAKSWLRHEEVCQLLNISSSTLKRMRIAGKLTSSKVGGSHYYAYKNIQKLLANDEKLR